MLEYTKRKKKIMLTSLFETIKEVYLCINFNWSPIVKDGVGNSKEIWLRVKFKNVLISTPFSEEEGKKIKLKQLRLIQVKL